MLRTIVTRRGRLKPAGQRGRFLVTALLLAQASTGSCAHATATTTTCGKPLRLFFEAIDTSGDDLLSATELAAFIRAHVDNDGHYAYIETPAAGTSIAGQRIDAIIARMAVCPRNDFVDGHTQQNKKCEMPVTWQAFSSRVIPHCRARMELEARPPGALPLQPVEVEVPAVEQLHLALTDTHTAMSLVYITEYDGSSDALQSTVLLTHPNGTNQSFTARAKPYTVPSKWWEKYGWRGHVWEVRLSGLEAGHRYTYRVRMAFTNNPTASHTFAAHVFSAAPPSTAYSPSHIVTSLPFFKKVQNKSCTSSTSGSI